MGEEENPAAPLSLKRNALQRFLYWLGWAGFGLVFKTVWRNRVINGHFVPEEGAVLFAANHASYVDPPLVGTSFKRHIYYMGKEELFRVPIFGWAIRQVNAFPIKRKEGDVGAFRLAQRILNAGGALVVFPEGKRQKTARFGPPKAGVGLLAKKTKVAVVPVYLHNTYRAARLAPFAVVFGAPMKAEPGESAQDFSGRVMKAITALREENFGPQP